MSPVASTLTASTKPAEPATFNRLTATRVIDELDAEHWMAGWEREAEDEGATGSVKASGRAESPVDRPQVLSIPPNQYEATAKALALIGQRIYGQS